MLNDKTIIDKKYDDNIVYTFYLDQDELSFVSELEKMYDDIINNFEYYISIFEMNYIDMYYPFIFVQEEEKRIIKTIVEDRFNNKKTIK